METTCNDNQSCNSAAEFAGTVMKSADELAEVATKTDAVELNQAEPEAVEAVKEEVSVTVPSPFSEPAAPSVTAAQVEDQIAKVEIFKVGEKTTVVLATLKNGFEIVASSSCVSAENYDHDIGARIARKRVVDEIWKLEGYQLQSFQAGRISLI